jgi:hypothetical protein
MSKRVQSNLTTPQQVGSFLLNADFFNSVPVEGQQQSDDFFAFMNEWIPIISEEVVGLCEGITFVPYRDTKEWLSQDLIESNFFIPILSGVRLYLQDWLLEVEEITYFDTTLDVYDFTAKTGDYMLMPRRDYPYTKIDVLGFALPVTTSWIGERITVDGFWGYHTNPAQLYAAVADDTSVTIADTTTTTVNVNDEADYETLQYIRIEDEIMLITARTDGGGGQDTLTVKRGVNGTTAAAHTAQPITIIKPQRDIQALATFLVAYNFQNRNTIADAVQVGDIGVIIPKIPQRYQATINRYQMIAEWQTAGAF